jgi:lipopolysaccharide transport system ATP-binding protein
MSSVAIRASGLGKRYRLGVATARYRTIRESLGRAVARFFGPRGDAAGQAQFWALKDVDFEIEHGEAVGIIGPNGAGKSTLLKILSRITGPTTGSVELTGRVGSLLEVGTGFHPELSGRENIFLNGAILGMRRQEILAQFDQIVDFSDTGRFLDTPVKHYSSGMYMRLAFAIAAHLEPDILVVDEVLAVGDAAFQKRCLGKMNDVARGGRTVLFVSHNMGAIKQLCTKGILLEGGRVRLVGTAEDAIRSYMMSSATCEGRWTRSSPLPREPGIYLRSIIVSDDAGETTGHVDSDSHCHVTIKAVATRAFADAEIAIRWTNEEGIPVFTTANTDTRGGFVPIEAGEHQFEVVVPANFLNPGRYRLTIAALIPRVRLMDAVEDLAIQVDDVGSHATATRDGRLGVVTPVFEWQHAASH